MQSTDERATGILKVVAWRMCAPSVSGGKVYTIAVVGNEVWTAWGTNRAAGAAGAGSQAKIIPCATPTAADDWAWKQTLNKTEKGYYLEIRPRVLEVDVNGNVLTVLKKILRHGETINIHS